MVHTLGEPGISSFPRQKCYLLSPSPDNGNEMVLRGVMSQELVMNPILINVSGYYYNHMDGWIHAVR